MKPLLLIDVDGVLNPFDAKPHRRPAGYQTHRMLPPTWIAQHPAGMRARPLRVWLNPEHGPQLLALPFDLAWCTTWQGDANEWIGAHLGLPELPHVPFKENNLPDRPDGTYFKTWETVQWVRGRAFAWVDDQVGDADREYVADIHPGPALLLTIDPATGLLPEHFEELADWAGSLELETTS